MISAGAVSHLPSMAMGASRVPAMIHFCETLCGHKSLLPIYQLNEKSLTSPLLACLSGNGKGAAPPVVVASILRIIQSLLDHEDGRLILSYLPHLVRNFSLLLQAQDQEGRDHLFSEELGLFCRVTEMAATQKKKGGTISAEQGQVYADLMALLLPRLRMRAVPGREETKVFILRTYASLVGAMPSPRKDLFYLAKLLGPSGINAGMNSPLVRPALVDAFVAMANNPTLQGMKPAAKVGVEIASSSRL